MGQGAPPSPWQWPQPLRSHQPALQRPSPGCRPAPQPADRYEQKCANDAKVGELHRAIAQVSVVLDKHLVPQRRMVATYRDQLKDLTDALKAAGEWVVAYARKSAMSKYFSANKERRQPYR